MDTHTRGLVFAVAKSGSAFFAFRYQTTDGKRRLFTLAQYDGIDCQSAFKFDPASASNFDPFGRRVLAVALAPSELVGVAETVRARAA